MVNQLQKTLRTGIIKITLLRQQINSSQQQQLQMVGPTAYDSLLQEVQYSRRIHDSTSVAAHAIMGHSISLCKATGTEAKIENWRDDVELKERIQPHVGGV